MGVFATLRVLFSRSRSSSISMSLAAFIASFILIVYIYMPLLLPLLHPSLEFIYGDFTTIVSRDSGRERFEATFYTFNPHIGETAIDTNRAFWIQAMSILAYIVPLTDAQLQSLMILISLLLGCVGLYILVCLFVRSDHYRSVLTIVMSTFYFLNLWGVERIGHIWIWYTYAVLPLFIALGILYSMSGGSRLLILYSMLFSIFGVIPHSFIYMLMIHIFLSTLLYIYRRLLGSLLIFFFTPLLLYVILNMNALIATRLINPSYPIPTTVDQFILLSRNADLINILTFSNNWWPQVPLDMIFNNTIFRVSSLSIFIITLSMILASWRDLEGRYRFLALLSLLFIDLAIFVAWGTNNPLLLYIIRLLESVRLLDIMMVFREWGRIVILVPVLLVLVISICLGVLKNNTRSIFMCTLFLAILISSISSPSTVYLNVFSPTNIPSEYYRLGEELSNSYKVLWIEPQKAENVLGTWRYTWNPDKAVSNILYWGIGYTYSNNFELINLMRNIEAPRSLLEALNIGAVILRSDIKGAAGFKANYTGLYREESYRYLTVYRTNTNSSPFSIANTVLSSLINDNLKIYSVFNISNNPNLAFVNSLQAFADVVLLDPDVVNNIGCYMLADPHAIVIKPADYTYIHNPSEGWSRAYTYDPLEAEWHPYLEERGIVNWQSDYGAGLAFTWISSKLRKPATPGENDLARIWEFNASNDIYEWLNYTPTNQWNALQTLSLDSGALRVDLWNSTWGWKLVMSPLISIEYGDWYRFEARIRGVNVRDLHIKIAEYAGDGRTMLSAKYMAYVGNGSFDWRSISIDYTPESPDAKYIQLQLWQGHETPYPLPNTIWVDYVKVYDLKRFVESVSLIAPFKVDRTGEYVVLLRLFRNELGGAIGVGVDDKEYVLNTYDPLNRFSWIFLDSIHLEGGGHRITISNLKGFNAVNLMVLMPRDIFDKIEEDLEKQLLGKKVLYILNRSDLYFENPGLYRELHIIRDGYYVFAIKGRGSLRLEIGDRFYNIEPSYPGWIYVGPLYLKKGLLELRIKPLYPEASNESSKAFIDTIAIYSTDGKGSEALENVLTNPSKKPAEVLYYEKVDPTMYIVKVRSRDPFLLIFREGYDPGWVANIDGEEMRSMPIYGTINGFWINRTGVLNITIEYKPQKLFYYSTVIGSTALASLLIYTLLDWVRIKMRGR